MIRTRVTQHLFAYDSCMFSKDAQYQSVRLSCRNIFYYLCCQYAQSCTPGHQTVIRVPGNYLDSASAACTPVDLPEILQGIIHTVKWKSGCGMLSAIARIGSFHSEVPIYTSPVELTWLLYLLSVRKSVHSWCATAVEMFHQNLHLTSRLR